MKSIFPVVKIVFEVIGIISVICGLILASYTILGTTFSEIYNADDRLQSELQSNDKLNRIYVDLKDPNEKVNILMKNTRGTDKPLEWTTIHDLRRKMFSPQYYSSTRDLREVYNFSVRINALLERVYYTFNPALDFISFLYRRIGFDVDKYGRGEPWIKAWVREIADHPIFLIAFSDYVKEGGVEYDLCIKYKKIIEDEIKRKGSLDSTNRIFPEFMDKNNLCRQQN